MSYLSGQPGQRGGLVSSGSLRNAVAGGMVAGFRLSTVVPAHHCVRFA